MENLNTDKHTEINKDKHSKNLNTDKHRESLNTNKHREYKNRQT